MLRKEAKLLAEKLGVEYEAHLDPKAKHFAVITVVGLLSWYGIIRIVSWVLR